jgi:hypothetical protein
MSRPVGTSPVSHEHGEYDPSRQMWFCGYWMTQDEWLDLHDYAPAAQKEEADDESEGG